MPPTIHDDAPAPSGPRTAPAPPAAVTGSATWAIQSLARDLRAAVADALEEAPEPVPLRGYWLLETVAAESARAQRELGDALGVDRSDMVRLVDSLEKSGLVERTRDPRDRRRRLITLTPDGEKARRRLRRRLADAEDAVLAASPDGTAAALRRCAGVAAGDPGDGGDRRGADASAPKGRGKAKSKGKKDKAKDKAKSGKKGKGKSAAKSADGAKDKGDRK
ncbi:MarR family winged helix-turn-helix transcriptional regulator [Corynebacterium sp. 335C]